MTGSMTPDDLETLSTLLDGELTGDARRFALRRLSHDAQWQQAASRWQLARDVMRGEQVLPAPGGFAARVADAVAAEAVAMTTPAVPASAAATTPQRRHARWIGGAALAASVVMAALFAVRMPVQPVAEEGLAGSGTAELASAPEPVPVPETPAAPVEGVSALAAAAPLALAAADAGRREGARSRGQQQRAAMRVSQARAPRAVVAGAAASSAPAPAAAVADSVSIPQVAAASTPAPEMQEPFTPAGEIISRPWPRALPVLSGREAFSASFNAGAGAAAPTFYPFEPRLPPELREQIGVMPPPLQEPALQY